MRLATVAIAAFGLILALGAVGCSNSGCPPVTPGSTSAGSSGSSQGSLSGGGSCPSTGGGGGGGTTSSAFLYYMDGSYQQLDAASLNASGVPTSLSSFVPPTFPALSPSNAMVVVNKAFLYVPIGDASIVAYTITASTGALTPIAGSPYTFTGAGTQVTATSDPQGRFLFIGAQGLPAIWVYQINASNGTLTPVAGSPFSGVFGFTSASDLAVDASGQFLFVGQGNPTLGVMVFSIDQTTTTGGTLTQVSGSPFYLGVAQLHAHPSSELLLGTAQVQNQSAPAAADNHIYVFSIANNGNLTQVANSPVATTYDPYDFLILPNGKFIYSFGLDSSTGVVGAIEGFSLNSSGQMAPMSGSPFTSLPPVYDCETDQGGSVAVCTNTLFGQTFQTFTVNSATGALAPVSNGTLTVTNNFPYIVTD